MTPTAAAIAAPQPRSVARLSYVSTAAPHAVAEQCGELAAQHGQLLQRGAGDLERGLEPAPLERQRERDRHCTEVKVAGHQGVAQVQAAVVDFGLALSAEAPQQGDGDRAATVAFAAVHDLACPGGLDHELRCDHVPHVGREHRNLTAEVAGDHRGDSSSAAVHVRWVGASQAPAAGWAGGRMRNPEISRSRWVSSS